MSVLKTSQVNDGNDLADLLGPSEPKIKILDACKHLIDQGAALHWLVPRQKNPIANEWSSSPRYTEAELRADYIEGANIGIRLGEPSETENGFTYIVDLDVRDPSKAAEAKTKLKELWPDYESYPTVISGSGGESRHFYFHSNLPMRKTKLARSTTFKMAYDARLKREVKKRDWEIELLGTGSQAVLPPSIHPDTGKPYAWLRPFSDSAVIADSVAAGFGVKASPDAVDNDEDNYLLNEVRTDTLEMDEDEVLNTVYDLPEDWVEDRDSWVMVGAAIHHQFGGNEIGFNIWCDWSQQSDKYEEKTQRSVWKSFKVKVRPVTMRTVIQAVNEARLQRNLLAVQVFDPDLAELLGDELPSQAQPIAVGQGEIMRNDKGTPLATLHNAIVYLNEVNRKRGLQIRFNDFTGRDEWVSGLIGDADAALIRVAIEQGGMRNVGSDLTAQAIRAVAQLNAYHPVQDWLGSLPAHDGVARLDTWLSRYLGATDSAYSRAAGRAFLIGMVARVMRPGCKLDTVLVLGGAQGIGKSTACRILAGDWTGDNLPSIREGSREAALYLRGHWLVEMAELSPSRKSEAEDLKAFLSRAEDETRAPYARRADMVPRQCVFVGTTNETEFLRDMTGGRRFWPVVCGDVLDLEGLRRDRAQLLAEALTAFKAGEQWHLKPDVEALAAQAQETAREEHPWESEIRAIVDAGDDLDMQPRNQIAVPELLRLLGIPVERQTTPQAKIVAGILRRLGWKRRVLEGRRLWER